MYWYILVCTGMYWDLPRVLGTRCCLYSPTRLFREPCVEYCELSRNSRQTFPLSSPADSSGGDRGGQLPFDASREAQTLKYKTGEKRYSIPYIVRGPQPPRYWGQKHVIDRASETRVR